MYRYLLLILLSVLIYSCSKSDSGTAPTPSDKGSISGKVIFATTGLPINKATITTTPSTSSVLTDSLGFYKIENIPPADYKLLVCKTGYDSTNVQVKVLAGINSVADVNLMLVDSTKFLKYGSIKGKVFDLITNNPLSNVIIFTNPASGTVMTLSDGSFEIKDITPGLITVTAYKSGFDTSNIKVTITKGVITPTNILLKQKDTTKPVTTGSISGAVVDAISKSAIYKVLITTEAATSAVTTDVSGKFTINNVNSGNYKVTASKTGYTTSIVNVTVTVGNISVADLNLMPETGSIQGIVSDALNGQKISGVVLKTNPASSIVSTDLSGQYLFDKLTAGSFTVIAQKSGYLNDTVSVKVTVGNITNADFYLKKTP